LILTNIKKFNEVQLIFIFLISKYYSTELRDIFIRKLILSCSLINLIICVKKINLIIIHFFLLLSFSFLFKKEAKQNPLFWSWCFIFIHSSSNLWSSVLRNLRSAFIKIFKAHQHIASIYINIYKSRRIIGTRERERDQKEERSFTITFVYGETRTISTYTSR
jgi:hypothetical protein